VTKVSSITVKAVMTEDDVAQIALQAPMRFTGWAPVARDRVVRGLIILAGVLAGLGVTLINWQGDESFMAAAAQFFAGPALVGVVLSVFYLRWIGWVTRRASRAYQTLPLAMTHVFDEQGIVTETRDQSGRAGWATIERAVETDQHVILYVAKLRAYVFKIAEVAEADREPLRQLIRQKVSKVEVRD
jgi:YcxB-like protein